MDSHPSTEVRPGAIFSDQRLYFPKNFLEEINLVQIDFITQKTLRTGATNGSNPFVRGQIATDKRVRPASNYL